MPLQVVHLPVKALRQPLHQARLGRRQVHTGHANLGESQLPGPGPQLRDQLGCHRIAVLLIVTRRL